MRARKKNLAVMLLIFLRLSHQGVEVELSQESSPIMKTSKNEMQDSDVMLNSKGMQIKFFTRIAALAHAPKNHSKPPRISMNGWKNCQKQWQRSTAKVKML